MSDFAAMRETEEKYATPLHRFEQVRHYLAIAEEATSRRIAELEDRLEQQCDYVTQLERDTLELEKMTKLLAGQLANHKLLPGIVQAHDLIGGLDALWLAWAEREAKG